MAAAPVVRRLAVAASIAVLAVPATGQATIAFQKPTGTGDRIHLANDDGGGAHVLAARGTNAVISPDGTRLAYQPLRGSAGPGPVRILTIAGGSVVASGQICRNMPVWSPDGTRLVCVTETATAAGFVSGEGLALIDAATGARTTLVRAPGNQVDSVDWSPDGTRIAYSAGRFGSTTSNVYVADPASMPARILAVRDATGPVWGPARIAVTRYARRRVRIGGQPSTVIHSQIWTVNPGGGGARRLTSVPPGPFLITGPFASAWTPDGTTVIGSIGGDDHSVPITVNAASGAVRRLGSSRVIAYPEAVSADGRTLLMNEDFIAGAGRLRLVGIGGRRGRIILRGISTVSVTANWQP
ncbi:MAG: PD40 domain-containing protein [Thermoleophilia bacterium]|nr:PD40 domain-containing protein [Thermoleophilia bacterium]